MLGSIAPRTLSAYKRLGGGGQQRLYSSEVSQPPHDFYGRAPESALTSCAATPEPRPAGGRGEEERDDVGVAPRRGVRYDPESRRPRN
ncbi:hypothetical protein EYF80_056687 [Liparis tanakae]|uniref:Uncharacterized protein n=1 Tax=Liparis tanakae TaxID=230148 RepID=A0A4Z2EWF6_9TELE|nr:hypothetical protein EYF80_056687 [Liparis tanakae]